MSAQAIFSELELDVDLVEFDQIYQDVLTGQRYVKGSATDKSFPSTVVSLFSGAGGLDIGLERAGFETLACIEVDKDCRETLRRNRPDWHLFAGNGTPGDIRGVDGAKLLSRLGLQRGELGLVVGGPPCQPFSNLGKKQGKEDSSNGDLFSHYVRLIAGLLPHGFIFENVEGFAQEKHRDVRDYLVKELQGLGYKVAFQVLVAADYGDPQIRRRFVMLGVRTGKNMAAMPFPKHFEWESKALLFARQAGASPSQSLH